MTVHMAWCTSIFEPNRGVVLVVEAKVWCESERPPKLSNLLGHLHGAVRVGCS